MASETKTKLEKEVLTVPRGRSKSGRFWREPGSRSKSIVVPFGRKKSWKSRQTLRCETKAMKELEKEMKESVLKEREEKKKKMSDRRQRKIDNQKKGEIIQKITNVAKLKRLKKKQMRKIEKR